MALGPDAAAYQVGRFLYVYDARTSTWDRLDVEAIAEDKKDAARPRADEARPGIPHPGAGREDFAAAADCDPRRVGPSGTGRAANVVLRKPNRIF